MITIKADGERRQLRFKMTERRSVKRVDCMTEKWSKLKCKQAKGRKKSEGREVFKWEERGGGMQGEVRCLRLWLKCQALTAEWRSIPPLFSGLTITIVVWFLQGIDGQQKCIQAVTDMDNITYTHWQSCEISSSVSCRTFFQQLGKGVCSAWVVHSITVQSLSQINFLNVVDQPTKNIFNGPKYRHPGYNWFFLVIIYFNAAVKMLGNHQYSLTCCTRMKFKGTQSLLLTI